MKMDDKPPSLTNTICDFVTGRIYSGTGDRSAARRRKVAFIQHLFSPNLSSRLRNDSFILANL